MRFKRSIQPVLLIVASTLFAADQIKEVENGFTPAGKGITLELVENLRLTPDMSDDYIWGGLGTQIQVDAKGKMYVVDLLNRKITQLDKDGKFIGLLGGIGQGPGEFQVVSGFRVLKDGRSLLFENRGGSQHITYYKEDGTYEKNTLVQGGVMFAQGVFSPDGERAGGMWVELDMPNRKMHFKFGIVGNGLKALETFTGYELPMPDQASASKPSYWTEFLGENFKSIAHGKIAFTAFDTDGNAYSAVADKYRVTRRDAEMQTTLVFGRKYKPIPQTIEEIHEAVDPIADGIRGRFPPNMQHLISKNTIHAAIELADFPPVKHPITAIFTAHDGYVFVLHNLDLRKQKGYFDIFDKTGAYVGDFQYTVRGLTGANSMIFEGGFAYNMEENEDGETELARYTYKLKSR